MHLMIELYLNRVPIPLGSAEMTMFLKFASTLHGMKVYRTEWATYAEDLRLAGSIDLVAENEHGKLVIFDWKRTKELHSKYTNPWGHMLHGLRHLPDSAGWHYRLQLNMYRYLLENYYNRRVADMYVVCLHPDNDGSAYVDTVPFLSLETAVLVDWQRRKVADEAGLGRHAQAPFSNVCLVNALKCLGYPVSADRSGPLLALYDGNRLLGSLGRSMRPCNLSDRVQGHFVIWQNHHFSGLRVNGRATHMDGSTVVEYDSVTSFQRALLTKSREWLAFEVVRESPAYDAHSDVYGGAGGLDDSQAGEIDEELSHFHEGEREEIPVDMDSIGGAQLSCEDHLLAQVPPDARHRSSGSASASSAVPSRPQPPSDLSRASSSTAPRAPVLGCAEEGVLTHVVKREQLDGGAFDMESAFSGVVDCEQDQVVSIENDSTSISKCRQRRLQKGAATTKQDFAKMWSKQKAAAAGSLADVVPCPDDTPRKIILRKEALSAYIRGRFPEWCSTRVRLASAALALYKLRLVDMFMREHVLLLWIIEGDEYLRVHNGVCYMYDEAGAFQAYKGVPPESTFERVKEFLLHLEGLFRTLPRNTPRNDDDVLNAIQATMVQYASLDEYLRRCNDAALFCLGSKKKRSEADREGDDVDADLSVPWHVWTAQGISKIGGQIQQELLHERLISYTVEWCEKPTVAVPGVAYTDCSVRYVDSEGPPYVRFVARSNNA